MKQWRSHILKAGKKWHTKVFGNKVDWGELLGEQSAILLGSVFPRLTHQPALEDRRFESYPRYQATKSPDSRRVAPPNREGYERPPQSSLALADG